MGPERHAKISHRQSTHLATKGTSQAFKFPTSPTGTISLGLGDSHIVIPAFCSLALFFFVIFFFFFWVLFDYFVLFMHIVVS